MPQFTRSVDAKLLGRKTFDLSVEMGAPFSADDRHYVFSRRPPPASVPAGVEFVSQPIGAFAIASDTLDVYQVLDQMSARKWALTGLLKPAAIHVSPTLRQAQPGVAERFLHDLRESVDYVRTTPNIEGGMAPIYGLAASIPDRTIVHEMLKGVMDIYYRL